MDENLRCLFLPLRSLTLLLPYSGVAEVVTCENIKLIESLPSWVLGTSSWRGLELMIVDFEKMGEGIKSKYSVNEHPSLIGNAESFRIAVLNRSHKTSPYNFLGVMLKNIPKMNRLKKTDFQLLAEFPNESLLMEVMAKDQKVVIPNLDWLEEKVGLTLKPEGPLL